MDIWIYGSGDLGREIFFAIKEKNKSEFCYKVLGFIDDTEGFEGRFVEGIEVKYWSSLTEKQINESKFIIAIGNSSARQRVREKIEINGGCLAPPLVHPKAHVSENVQLEPGVYIAANTTIAIAVTIESNVIINQNCSIGHDSLIKSDVVISPGCVISGRVKVGNASFLGSAAIVLPKLNVGEMCIVGANVTVAQNIEAKQKVLVVTRNMSIPIE